MAPFLSHDVSLGSKRHLNKKKRSLLCALERGRLCSLLEHSSGSRGHDLPHPPELPLAKPHAALGRETGKTPPEPLQLGNIRLKQPIYLPAAALPTQFMSRLRSCSSGLATYASEGKKHDTPT